MTKNKIASVIALVPFLTLTITLVCYPVGKGQTPLTRKCLFAKTRAVVKKK